MPTGEQGEPWAGRAEVPRDALPWELPSWLAGAPLLSSLALKARGTNVSAELADIQRGFPGEG